MRECLIKIFHSGDTSAHYQSRRHPSVASRLTSGSGEDKYKNGRPLKEEQSALDTTASPVQLGKQDFLLLTDTQHEGCCPPDVVRHRGYELRHLLLQPSLVQVRRSWPGIRRPWIWWIGIWFGLRRSRIWFGIWWSWTRLWQIWLTRRRSLRLEGGPVLLNCEIVHMSKVLRRSSRYCCLIVSSFSQ
ncbi:uncharacterized protein LOC112577381 [Pomacea canaliculata]|uniref:uncharacterized protein LOC112577381 n=1 Tax=Pomacea canaliculata TaxID=400727 RepID=UPI000D73354E|nr:uncharacterized protein LOC112577381 [Pomacea canaliculata]